MFDPTYNYISSTCNSATKIEQICSKLKQIGTLWKGIGILVESNPLVKQSPPQLLPQETMEEIVQSCWSGSEFYDNDFDIPSNTIYNEIF